MAECTRWQNWIEDGTSTLQEAHMQECEECRANWQMHLLLRDSTEFSFPSEELFSRMRRQVLRKLNRGKLRMWFIPIVAAAAAFVLGMWIQDDQQPLEANLQDVRYSDFKVLENREGQVRVGFVVSEYREALKPVNDPVLREMAAQSMLYSPNLATRINLVNEATVSPEIMQVLLQVVVSDPALAVRTRAMERLMECSPSPEIIHTMLTVVQRDDHVHLRLKALEYLLQNSGDQVLNQIQALQNDPDPAIRFQIQEELLQND